MLLCAASVLCLGAAFSVNPTGITLDAQHPSALMTVFNSDDRALRFEARVFAWEQDANGQMHLTSSKDVGFYPSLFRVEPQGQQRIRVGTLRTPPDSGERAYRLYVKELPDATDDPEAAGVHITLLTEMGMPVFVVGGQPRPQPSLALEVSPRGELGLHLRNDGSGHLPPGRIEVRGWDGADALGYEETVDAWYVLAGTSWHKTLHLSPRVCGTLSRLVVSGSFGPRTLRFERPLDATACGPSMAAR